MTRLFTTVFATYLVSFTVSASGFGDPNLGEQKSPSCVFCHNPNGAPTQASYPNLNGQDPLYLFNAMKAYQLGERKGALSEMMKVQLRNLNEDDLKDVAAFYATRSN
ncbi:c-type cytochrome [Vibrio methylphosphonaticus]|uniref:c-type cytochrome n=1 Tax=Vibrio methylphosphonaticus TaxID=2946866 RepID=UPI002029DC50|nr:cytochrome c [Vibrio methylphosphonaticus]MCL9776655.1 cytochrome c [Vibrio methylphosphonaticus]